MKNNLNKKKKEIRNFVSDNQKIFYQLLHCQQDAPRWIEAETKKIKLSPGEFVIELGSIAKEARMNRMFASVAFTHLKAEGVISSRLVGGNLVVKILDKNYLKRGTSKKVGAPPHAA